MLAPSIGPARYDPHAPSTRSCAVGAALVVGDSDALAEEVFSGGRRGIWLRPGRRSPSSPVVSGVPTRRLRPGGLFDWPCGSFALIVLGHGIEHLEGPVLAQLGRLCLSSLELHGEIQLRLDGVGDAEHHRVRRCLGRTWPLFVIRRRLSDGSERYIWRRTLGALAGGQAPAALAFPAASTTTPRIGGA